ncbi:hypothetical protein PR048_030161 [Dryococelus australis]|uniref:Uncharacterized protein n=1 Tax=Dryococelus australis TaxID=614101 RepID=A0ABQ9G8Y2_9NEOP|nr:hypothetical protein PR048_030161 [Dryococelus australis]
MFWTHPYIEININCYSADRIRLQNHCDHLLEMRVSAVTDHNTNMRECVSAAERLLITLR